MSDQPKAIEPVPVQLTRIEGVVNLIAYQIGDLKEDVKTLGARVDGHDGEIGALKLAVGGQQAASASWKTWLPILASLAGLALALFIAITRP